MILAAIRTAIGWVFSRYWQEMIMIALAGLCFLAGQIHEGNKRDREEMKHRLEVHDASRNVETRIRRLPDGDAAKQLREHWQR